MGFPRALEQTYEVLDAIGCGGFARVFRVRHRDLDRVMALKLMPVFGPDQRDEQKRCRREITTLARLSHPGLVRILDVGEAEGHLYYTMELYPGPDLGSTLRTHQTLPPGRICDIGIQVARALGHIHREGVVHRDIKPENILFDAREGAILADFGLAHVTDVTAMTKESEILGTPLYLSPEQINGDRVSPATDIYQLGVVLFKAASGKVPFGEQGFAQLCEAIVRQPPPRPTTFRADLPRPLEAVILRCLEKDPARRWPSAAALEEALRSAAKGLFTPTPTAGRPADPGPAPASGPEASPPEKGPDGEGRMGLSIVLGFVVGSLVMIACWAFIGRVPRHQALVGQTTVVVAFDGPIAEQPAVTLRTAGGGAPLAPSRIEGASVRFDRLTTDTRYLLEWRRSWGTTAGEELRTLPDLGSTLAVELTTGPAGVLEIQLHRRDARIARSRLEMTLGDASLERIGSDRFRCPAPGAGEVRTMAVALPEVGESIDLAVPAANEEALCGELVRLERELERLLRVIKQPAWIPGIALDPPEPHRFAAARPEGQGASAFLERLRRLAPAVSAAIANERSSPTARWKLVWRVSRLVGAEALAGHAGQRPVGILHWMAPLFRVERRQDCRTDDRVKIRLTRSTLQLVDARFARHAFGSVVEVVSGVADTRIASEERLDVPDAYPGPWLGLKVCGQAMSTSAAPILSFPGSHASVEMPLILWERRLKDRGSLVGEDAFAPVIALNLWFHRGAARTGWGSLNLDSSFRQESFRIAPTYIFNISLLGPRWSVGPPGRPWLEAVKKAIAGRSSVSTAVVTRPDHGGR